MSGFFQYIRGSIAELRQVTWPTRKEVLQYTVIILVSIVVAMFVVALVDYGLGFIVDTFLIS